MGLFYFLKILYREYNLRLRLAFNFFIFFIIAFACRLLLPQDVVAKSILFFFFLSLVFWLVIFPDFFTNLSVIFCKIIKYTYIFTKSIRFIRILNLFYNLRNVITRGHPLILFVYNIVFVILFTLDFPGVFYVRFFFSLFFMLGSIIDLLHQCFMHYGYIGWPLYRGKWRERYRYLEWSKDNSLWLQVRYNQIVLQRLHYMFEDDNLDFYSRDVLFYGFRPAYALDVFFNKFFRKKN